MAHLLLADAIPTLVWKKKFRQQQCWKPPIKWLTAETMSLLFRQLP